MATMVEGRHAGGALSSEVDEIGSHPYTSMSKLQKTSKKDKQSGPLHRRLDTPLCPLFSKPIWPSLRIPIWLSCVKLRVAILL